MTAGTDGARSARTFAHDFPSDPSYSCGLGELLRIPAPEGPADFDAFWLGRYEEARAVAPQPEVGRLVEERDGVRIHEVSYHCRCRGRRRSCRACGAWRVAA